MMRGSFAALLGLVLGACGGTNTDKGAPPEPADHTVVDGGDCRADIECVSGSCYPTDVALGCGHCQPRVATGGCYSDAHCTVGNHCEYSDYYVGVCVANAPGTPAPGCSSPCAAGSVCYGNTCRTLGKAGEPCTPSGDVHTCEVGLICPPASKTCEVPRSIAECRPLDG